MHPDTNIAPPHSPASATGMMVVAAGPWAKIKNAYLESVLIPIPDPDPPHRNFELRVLDLYNSIFLSSDVVAVIAETDNWVKAFVTKPVLKRDAKDPDSIKYPTSYCEWIIPSVGK